MNKYLTWKKPSLLAVLLVGSVLFACQPQDETLITQDAVEFIKYQHGDIIPGKYIVTLNPTGINSRRDMNYEGVQASMRKSVSSLLASYRISEEKLSFVYGSAIEGFAVELTDAEFQSISKDPSVKLIEPDRIVALAPPPGKGPNKPGDGGGGGSPTQTTPYGITRVDGGATYSGDGVAYIIDSGIDSSHPDLNVDVSKGFNAFTKGRDSDLSTDGNGHGTHVAGTVAAIDNSIGVIGVAAGATVVPVKVLDSRGSGSYSGVIAGVDFVRANASSLNGDVANMSLGGPPSAALDNAVIALGASGIKIALAAGNESQHANNSSPARANGTNVYTVSAIDINDEFAYFSNYGNPPVDYAAPGVGVLSTVPGGYATFNGTSMASPHVAGLLLLGPIKTTTGTAIGDPDGNPDPIASN